jgi:hypothetical protein
VNSVLWCNPLPPSILEGSIVVAIVFGGRRIKWDEKGIKKKSDMNFV